MTSPLLRRFRARCFSAAVLALFTVAVGSDAQERQQTGSTAKHVWEWTPEERLERRFEPVAAAARRAAAIRDGCEIPDANVNVVMGSRNPELFLPSELMDLLSPAFDAVADVRAKKRAAIAPRVESLGLPADFWERLDDVARSYFAAQSDLRRLNLEVRSATNEFIRDHIYSELRRINDSLCPTRAAAIAAARKEFGPLVFDRFLYQTIGPDAMVSVTLSSSGSGADSLLWVEEGCR